MCIPFQFRQSSLSLCLALSVALPSGVLAQFRATLQERSHGPISVLKFTADGKLLASANTNGSIRLWDLTTAKRRAILEGHKGSLLALAITPDGKRLTSRGAD